MSVMVATIDLGQADPDVDPTLFSSVTTTPADALLSDAIATTLRAGASTRGELFGRLLGEIEAFMGRSPQERPWTFEAFIGTDGSKIFRGQTGRSIVVDPLGTLWKARSYEDFDTEYLITGSSCTIVSLRPKYEDMQPYSSRPEAELATVTAHPAALPLQA